MKPVTITFCSILLVLAISCNDAAKTDNADAKKTDTAKKDTASMAMSTETATPTAKPLDSAAMMKAMADYATPGDMQKMLASQNGDWNEDISFYMAPDGPPMTMKASVSNKMILGGRYQQSTHKGSFQGQPYEGVSTIGYDNVKKVFVSSFIDNMGTGMMLMEGPWDPATKSCTLKGKMTEPSYGKEIEAKEVMTFIDAKNQKLEMYMTPPGGKEYKSMEIKYSKK
jgi:hypothetical protein